jgi:hypothetical protein
MIQVSPTFDFLDIRSVYDDPFIIKSISDDHQVLPTGYLGSYLQKQGNEDFKAILLRL